MVYQTTCHCIIQYAVPSLMNWLEKRVSSSGTVYMLCPYDRMV